MKNIFILLIMSALPALVSAQSTLPDSRNKQTSILYHSNTNTDRHNFIAVNSIRMWISNNGIGSQDPVSDGNGFFWPGGINAVKSAIFFDGLVFGAKVNDDILFGGSLFTTTLQGGKIINQKPDDPLLAKYRVYKINRYWEQLPPGPERELRKKDYDEWPIEDGAPYEDLNGDGNPTPGIDKPKYLGDETLWCVSNDFSYQPRTGYTPPRFSRPLGLEIQTTVFGYNKANILGDAVFKKYKIINKGEHYLKDMYVSFYSDPDLGDNSDDFIGCDTMLNMGFVWNSDNMDGNGSGSTYGENPPGAGYTIITGPVTEGILSDSVLFEGQWIRGKKNIGLTGFVLDFEFFWNPRPELPSSYYNLVQGRSWKGDLFVNPLTGEGTTKVLSGDPVKGIGWYEEGWPKGLPGGDRRFFLSSGPFNFAPGDTQEVVYAIHMARGTSNVSSISFLREQSRALRQFYYSEAVSMYESSEQILDIPEEYQLYQNYPNPFNPGTTITYHIPIDGNVILKVYDILGNEISTLVNEFKPAGSYQVTWNAKNLSAGIYFYQIDTGGYVRTKKMILMK